MLTHPGTPCVFWDHLQSGGLRDLIQRLIAVRRRAGIHCRSAVQILKCAGILFADHARSFRGSHPACQTCKTIWGPGAIIMWVPSNR